MHFGPRPLILPNVWDPVSARAFEAAGFTALATSSAAVAATLGYADGRTPGAQMLAAAGRIAAWTDVPVTADIENGYGLPPAELAARLAQAGLAGCNLEDSDPVSGELTDAARQAEFIAAVRAAAGRDLVINARVDVFVRAARNPGRPGQGGAGQEGAGQAGGGQDGTSRGGSAGDGEDIVAEAVRRASRYLEAGADCAYPILAPASAVAGLVRRIPGPVNVLYLPGGADLAELAAAGVARITFGGGLHQQAAQSVRELARALAAQASRS